MRWRVASWVLGAGGGVGSGMGMTSGGRAQRSGNCGGCSCQSNAARAVMALVIGVASTGWANTRRSPVAPWDP